MRAKMERQRRLSLRSTLCLAAGFETDGGYLASCSELVTGQPPCGLSKSPNHFSFLLSYAEEIVAHASNVSSLVLGKASGRLLATGGDDCRVNLWSINKPNCIMVSGDVPHPTLG